MSLIRIKKNPVVGPCSISVPASKSESNRALIIKALAGSGLIRNLSTARDTQTMQSLLNSDNHVLDVIDAGTTMRFLTAYLAITNQDRIITGTTRMCERPVGILVDALRELGARIDFIGKEGFPPLHIRGFEDSKTDKIRIRGDVSSQYISAILMISPLLERGLRLVLTGKIGSRPYIDMTLGIMEHFGVKASLSGDTVEIPHQAYQETTFDVAPDWSGASYWYSIAALAPKADIQLDGFRRPSFQGDSIIQDMMPDLGVISRFTEKGLSLTQGSFRKEVSIDFTGCPDLAQTIAVVCAAKGIHARIRGLESLRIKETDRIAALQNELSKLDSHLIEKDKGAWEIIPSNKSRLPKKITVLTYDDHRMAMSFAPLAALMDVEIENQEVVVKSYPGFWEDLARAGFQLQTVS